MHIIISIEKVIEKNSKRKYDKIVMTVMLL